jgi:hypothetical protein
MGDIRRPVCANRHSSRQRSRQRLACRLQDVKGFCRCGGMPNGYRPDLVLDQLLRVHDLSLSPALPFFPAAYRHLEEQPRKEESTTKCHFMHLFGRKQTHLNAITICLSWSGEVHKRSEIGLFAPPAKMRLKNEEPYSCFRVDSSCVLCFRYGHILVVV